MPAITLIVAVPLLSTLLSARLPLEATHQFVAQRRNGGNWKAFSKPSHSAFNRIEKLKLLGESSLSPPPIDPISVEGGNLRNLTPIKMYTNLQNIHDQLHFPVQRCVKRISILFQQIKRRT